MKPTSSSPATRWQLTSSLSCRSMCRSKGSGRSCEEGREISRFARSDDWRDLTSGKQGGKKPFPDVARLDEICFSDLSLRTGVSTVVPAYYRPLCPAPPVYKG